MSSLRLSDFNVMRSLCGAAVDAVTKRNCRHLIISGSWVGLIEGGIVTYLPVFLARLGASPTLMSLLTAGQFLVGMVAYIPGGAYAERHADQVRLANISSIIARSSYLLIALLPLAFGEDVLPPLAVAIWTLAAVPTAVFMPSFFTVMQQAIPVQIRARFLGVRWAIMTLISAISVPLFGLLLDHTPFTLGYQLVFACSFLASVLHMVHFGRIQVPPFATHSEEVRGNRGRLGGVWAFLHSFAESPLFVRYLLATLAFRIALYIPYALFSVYWVRDLHANDTVIGIRGGVGYAFLALGYVLWGRWSHQWGDRSVLFLAGLLFGLYPLLTVLIPSMEWLPVVAVLWGFAGAGMDIGLFAMMMALSPEDKRPRFVAATYVLSSFTSFVGPLLGAVLAEALGVRACLLIGGALQLLSALCFLWLPGRDEVLQQHPR
ncbi:MAG: MFS transporter [Anaerolineae bacterium]|nr:MFS transporter [Anaerolineae bacterium]